jgi:hypothetical protein
MPTLILIGSNVDQIGKGQIDPKRQQHLSNPYITSTQQEEKINDNSIEMFAGALALPHCWLLRYCCA